MAEDNCIVTTWYNSNVLYMEARHQNYTNQPSTQEVTEFTIFLYAS